jgi:cytoskeletal protein CcmA (bactofilin family)
MWKRNDEPQAPQATTVADVPSSPPTFPAAPGQPVTATRQPSPRAPGGPPARFGTSLKFVGKLAGDEDLVVDGRFEGEIQCPTHMVTVGPEGRVQGEVLANAIVVEGEVRGNLVATEQVLVRASGMVHGDIRAPRVALDQGCRFKGAIDMEPQVSARPADLPQGRRDRQDRPERPERSENERRAEAGRPTPTPAAS